MPKKKITPAEEPEQTAGLMEQAGEAATAPPGEPPQDVGAPNDSPPLEVGELGEAVPGDDSGFPGDSEGEAEEVMVVDVSGFPPDGGPEGKPPEPMPEVVPPMGAQEPGPTEGVSMEDGQPASNAPPAMMEDALPPESLPNEDAPPAPPLTDRQSFFALDFHELDRGLSQEERQAWNSIYASFRGHSALSGTVIGADPHSMNVRNKETG